MSLMETLLTVQGKHAIEIDHSTMGQTCGILPVGIAKAFVTTTGLKWNLGEPVPLRLGSRLLARLVYILRWRCVNLKSLGPR